MDRLPIPRDEGIRSLSLLVSKLNRDREGLDGTASLDEAVDSPLDRVGCSRVEATMESFDFDAVGLCPRTDVCC